MSSISTQELVAGLNAAGTKYGVPESILLGVSGMETGYGKNIATSSTGAMGVMQFEPATAASYGYPMTNTPTSAQATQQFDAAAKYLSSLYKQHGNNWNAALQAYSGGGYGLSQVQAKAAAGVGVAGVGGGSGAQQSTGSITSLLPPVPDPLSGVSGAITGVFNQAVSDAKYAGVLVGILIVGGMLIVHGLTGATPKSVANRATEAEGAGA